MSEEGKVYYKCMSCGKISPAEKWELVEFEFRCPECGYRVAAKIRPPIVKRIKAI
jgi:DNA-directed RNA polymerase subunit RPC12/RpoP